MAHSASDNSWLKCPAAEYSLVSRLWPHHSPQICVHRNIEQWWANILNHPPGVCSVGVVVMLMQGSDVIGRTEGDMGNYAACIDQLWRVCLDRMIVKCHACHLCIWSATWIVCLNELRGFSPFMSTFDTQVHFADNSSVVHFCRTFA